MCKENEPGTGYVVDLLFLSFELYIHYLFIKYLTMIFIGIEIRQPVVITVTTTDRHVFVST